MKHILYFILAGLFGASTVSAQRIQDINTYLSQRADYVSTDPEGRLIKLAGLVREGRATQAQLAPEVRKNVVQYIATARLRGTGALGSEGAEEELFRQASGVFQQRDLDDQFGGGVGGTGIAGQDTTRLKKMRDRERQQRTDPLSTIQLGIMSELGAWGELRNLGLKDNPLASLDLPVDVMNQTAVKVMLTDKRFVAGTPVRRLQVLGELKGQMIWGDMLQNAAHTEFAKLLATQTDMLPPRASAEVRLRNLQQYLQVGLVSWGRYASGIEEEALTRLLELTPDYAEAGEAGKLDTLRSLYRDRLISTQTKSKYEIPTAVQVLASTPGFNQLDKRSKQMAIRRLEKQQLIEFISIPYIEKAFGLR